MATYTSTIHLYGAGKDDYEDLFSKLEKQVLKNKWHIIRGRKYKDGKSECKWTGNISIQELTNTIFRSLSESGKRFSFTIVKKKLMMG